ncbi:hypothetical protein QOT17_020368 [Balamuthia mandrillaris]
MDSRKLVTREHPSIIEDGLKQPLLAKDPPSPWETNYQSFSNNAFIPKDENDMPLVCSPTEIPEIPPEDPKKKKKGFIITSWSRQEFFMVVLLAIAFGFARTAVFIQLRVTPDLANSLSVTKSEVNSAPLGCFFFGGTFAAPIASKLMVRVGRQKGFMIGGALGLFGSAVAIMSTYLHHRVAAQESDVSFGFSFAMLCVGSLFLGMASGFSNLIRFCAAEVVPDRKSLAIAFVLFGADVASLSGPPLADWTKDLLWKYGACYISLVFLFISCIVTLWFIPMPPATKLELAQMAPPRPISKLLQVPRLVLAFITATVSFGMMALLMVSVTLDMLPKVDSGEFKERSISEVLQVHSVGMFTPGLFVGFLIQWYGCISVDAVGLLFIILSNIIMAIRVEYWTYMVGMSLCGVGWNLSYVSSTALLTQQYSPSEKATTQGMNDFVMSFIVSSLSLSAEALRQSLGWRHLNLLSLGFCAFALLAIIFVKCREWIKNGSKSF